ncbi:MAG: hypothetical protein HQL97_04345 [Magnetococcales bacterium]|nr:hypothetical protein [Magnetococcales bacterium]
MNERYFPLEWRERLIAALPDETSTHGNTPQAGHLYLPATHAKALHPDTMLVEGMRGSGKSFWCAALQDPKLRALIGARFGIDAQTRVSVGFSEDPPEGIPGRDTLEVLLNRDKIKARVIWRTVVFKLVVAEQAPETFQKLGFWKERIAWVLDHPEQVDQAFIQADRQLVQEGRYHLVLFDALDRIANDWPSMNALVKGILQVVLDFRVYRRIRLKVFARPDQLLDPSVSAFPDASKVVTSRVSLQWPRTEMYGLLWQYLGNDPELGGEFRQASMQELMSGAVPWKEQEGVWLVPEPLRRYEEIQKRLFHRMTGPWMGKDQRRGFPYSWLFGHLADMHGQVTPRSFLAALRCAASIPSRDGQEYLLHYESIKTGVQEASKIRVAELKEDYPWINSVLKPLFGMVVPCSFQEIKDVWSANNVLGRLRDEIQSENVKLPPRESTPEGIMEHLEQLGLMERLRDRRFNMPDVYRVGYGLGRRGGVKPVNRKIQAE